MEMPENKKIKIIKENVSNRPKDLIWDDGERKAVVNRMVNLRDDQIGALLGGVLGVKFDNKDIKKIVKEIKKEGNDSINLDVLITEAESKEDILWWLNYFEEFVD